jgi:carbon-monoxide dehydrogenase medium subunit
VIPHSFEYHAPTSLPDAIALMGRYGDEAKFLAGGHSLLPMMKLRFAQPGHLIDLGRIPDLKGISQVGNEIHIGAMTTENPALMLALDASFVLKGPKGERVVKADGFFLGLYSTLMEPGEILTAIRVPIPAPGTGWAYEKLKRKIGDFATAAAAVLLRMKGPVVESVSIALTNLGATPLKASAAEAFLRGKKLDEPALNEAARLAMSICDPAPDQRGDAEYKTAMAGEMTRRALLSAHSRAAS